MRHQVATDDGVIEVLVSEGGLGTGATASTGCKATPTENHRRGFLKKVGKFILAMGAVLTLGRISMQEAAAAPGDCGYCVERTACGTCYSPFGRARNVYSYRYYDAVRRRCDSRCTGYCTPLECQ